MMLPTNLDRFDDSKRPIDIIKDNNYLLLQDYINIEYFTESDITNAFDVPTELLDICFPYKRRDLGESFIPLVKELVKRENKLTELLLKQMILILQIQFTKT